MTRPNRLCCINLKRAKRTLSNGSFRPQERRAGLQDGFRLARQTVAGRSGRVAVQALADRLANHLPSKHFKDQSQI
jgi:hypothetical protein